MKIKQVEEVVGITSKNIRFYEEQGLLNPERLENGYREYHQNHINILMKIKLLRKLGVSVEDIKSVLDHKIPLDTCIERQIVHLEKEQENITNMSSLAKSIAEQSNEIDSLDTEQWLEVVEKMEKEGVDFVDTSRVDVHMKKKAGTVAVGIVFIGLSVITLGAMTWLYFIQELPLLLMILFSLGPLITIICMVVVMKSRIKEIDGGEEDEASKY